jgi:gamma-glutamylcyclotransferase (GGCT)/AIG2-like uncharacterized protein YtfP
MRPTAKLTTSWRLAFAAVSSSIAGNSYVFGYGALTASRLRSPRVVHVNGFKRTWNVAMDNRVTIPGYKYYVDPKNGARPGVFVTFLNLTEDGDCAVNGVVLRVDEQDLQSLDDRERNYVRLNVTDRVVEPIDGSVWAYIASPAGRRRYEQGVKTGRAVVDEAYYQLVRDQFAALGADSLDEFVRTTDDPACPLRTLTRIDI